MPINRHLLWIFRFISALFVVGAAPIPVWAKVIVDLVLAALTFPPLWDGLGARGWRVPVWTRLLVALAIFGAFWTLGSRPRTPAAERASAAKIYLERVAKLTRPCDESELPSPSGDAPANQPITHLLASANVEICNQVAESLKNEELPDYLRGQARDDVERAVQALSDVYSKKALVYDDLAKATTETATPAQSSAARARVLIPPTNDRLAALTTALQPSQSGRRDPNQAGASKLQSEFAVPEGGAR